jgi:hypothetical protein
MCQEQIATGEISMTHETKSKLQATLKAVRETIYAQIKADIESHPEMTYREIGHQYGCSECTVMRVAQRNGISRPVGPRPQASGNVEANRG